MKVYTKDMLMAYILRDLKHEVMSSTLTLPSDRISASGAFNVRSAKAAGRYLSPSPSAGEACEYGPHSEAFLITLLIFRFRAKVLLRSEACFLLNDT